MSQSGYTPIQLYYSTTAAAVPVNTNLANGELAINITDGKLYYKDNTGTVKVIAGAGGAGVAGGSTTQVQYNSSGSLAGSANMTFDGTSMTLGGNPTLSAGTANGVTYLNGSKVLTSGSALTFDGSKLTVTSSGEQIKLTSSGDFSSTGTGYLRFYDSVGAKGYVGYGGTASQFEVNTGSSMNLYLNAVGGTSIFAVSNAEQMRLTSTGLGIGTSSPSYKLDVYTSVNNIAGARIQNANASSGAYSSLWFDNDSAGIKSALIKNSSTNTGNVGTNSFYMYYSDTGSSGIYNASASPITFSTNGSEKMRLNSGGNLGLGITPSAWDTYTVMQFPAGAVSSVSVGQQLDVSQNTFYASGFKYTATAASTLYRQTGGTHTWYTAASGTAGTAISFTQAMTLLANGNLGLGVTPVGNSGNGNAIEISYGGTIHADAGNPAIAIASSAYRFDNDWKYKNGSFAPTRYTQGSGTHSWFTAPIGTTGNVISFTQIMTLDGSGNLGVGTTSPSVASGLGIVVNGGAGQARIALKNTNSGDASGDGFQLAIDTSSNAYIDNRENTALIFNTNNTERLRIASTGAFGLSGANYGTSGQVLTSGGSGAAPTWTTVGGGGGSAATPTALGTVYGSMTTSGASPYLTALGYNAGAATTGARNVFVGQKAGEANVTGPDNVAIGFEALRNYTEANGGNIAIGSYALTTATSGTSYYNVAIGYEAMNLNTSGYNNVAVGWRALKNNTSGRYSTAIGYGALQALLSGNDGTTAVGALAGSAITTGIYNVVVGGSALSALTTNSYNTVMGYNALGTGTGDSNVAVGYNAMSTSGSKSNNVAIGREAMAANTTSSNNTAVGYLSGSGITTGSSNNLFGTNSGKSITTGTGNIIVGGGMSGAAIATGQDMIGIGSGCFGAAATGYQSIAIGNQSTVSLTSGLFNNGVGYATNNKVTTGGYNNALGGYCLQKVTTGSQNIGIGNGAGETITTGSDNICIGYVAGAYGTGMITGSSNIFIGYGTTPASSSDGNTIVIGNAGPFTGKGSSTTFIQSACYQGNNSSTWSTTSDQRLKKNIVDNNVGLDAINSIRVRNFEYRVEEEVTELPTHAVIKKEGVQLGVIAQELQAVLPDCVRQETTGVLSVDPDNLTWYMINAIKQLSEQVETLKSEIATLKGA